MEILIGCQRIGKIYVPHSISDATAALERQTYHVILSSITCIENV